MKKLIYIFKYQYIYNIYIWHSAKLYSCYQWYLFKNIVNLNIILWEWKKLVYKLILNLYIYYMYHFNYYIKWVYNYDLIIYNNNPINYLNICYKYNLEIHNKIDRLFNKLMYLVYNLIIYYQHIIILSNKT